MNPDIERDELRHQRIMPTTERKQTLNGDSIDTPQVANLTEPTGTRTVNGMALDMTKMTEAAQRLGVGKGDVISVRGYLNAKGVVVPDYESARIERRAHDDE